MSRSEFTANRALSASIPPIGPKPCRDAFVNGNYQDVLELPEIEYTSVQDLADLGYDIPTLTNIVE